MGIHLGDVLVEGDDLIGDGVNIAARLEAIAPPGGVCMSGTAHENVRGRLDVALTDLGEKTLKNIARPVRVYATAAGGTGERDAAAPDGRAGAPRLSMVVLPFANLGGGPEQEYFVDGVTESLTTDLSRISGAIVIARNTAFAYRGKSVDVREIGRDLNVRYVLEGSVQRSGDRMRVNVQLIEAETGTHLWAERFDKPVAGLFDMQDEIVARIANQLSAEIVRAEARRAETSAKPDAIDFWLRGYDWINRGVNPESLAEARACFERARAIERVKRPCDARPRHGRRGRDPHAFVRRRRREALPKRRRWRSGRWRSSRATPGRTTASASSSSFRGGRRRRSPNSSGRLRSTPISPSPTPRSASPSAFSAAPEETEAHVMEALRLSPRDSGAYIWFDFLCIANMLLGQDAGGRPWGRRAVEINRGYPMAHFHYAAALALCGRIDGGPNVRCGRGSRWRRISPSGVIGRTGSATTRPISPSASAFSTASGWRARRRGDGAGRNGRLQGSRAAAHSSPSPLAGKEGLG